MKPQIIFGFHAVGARLRTRAESVREIYVDAKRDDKRMQALLETAKTRNLRVMAVWDPLESTCRHASLSIL